MRSPILIVPYMWIGDFVRCHTVVKLLKQRFPARPIDVLTTSMVAPLLDYMPGVRKGVVADLPRHARARQQRARAPAARRKSMGGPGHAADLEVRAGAMARSHPCRTGFIGERAGLINDLRSGERRLPRMVDRCASLLCRPTGPCLPNGRSRNSRYRRPNWPIGAGGGIGLDGRPVIAFRARRGRPVQALAQRPLRRPGPAPRRRRPPDMGDRGPGEKARGRSRRPAAATSAISPGPTCAMRFSPSPPPMPRFRTIPVSSTSRPRSARLPWEFSARPALGIGLRSIRSQRSSRSQAHCPAAPVTSRCAASATTCACATFLRTRSPARFDGPWPGFQRAQRSELRCAAVARSRQISPSHLHPCVATPISSDCCEAFLQRSPRNAAQRVCAGRFSIVAITERPIISDGTKWGFGG